MNVSNVDSLRLAPWLLNANPPGIRGNALRSFSIVMVVLSFVLVREHEVIAGYTTPALERSGVIAVWVPLFLGFLLANGFVQVQAIPAMALLPAFVRKTRRLNALFLAGCVALAGAMGLFADVGSFAAMSVAGCAYGLGARAFWLSTDTPRVSWFLATLLVVLNGGTILAWADGQAWRAALLASAALVNLFFSFRSSGMPARVPLTGAIYPHGVTPPGGFPDSASLTSGDARLRAASAYLRRCRGVRFLVRLTVSVTLILGFAMATAFGVNWLFERAEAPDGSLVSRVVDSFWRMPGAGEKPVRFLASGSTIYYPLMLLVTGVLTQQVESGYLPFSRRALGRAAFRRFLITSLGGVGLLTVVGLFYAVLALIVSGAPWAGRIPNFLFVLPYVLTALPWAGVAAVAGREQIPFQTGSMAKVLGARRAVLAACASVTILLGSIFLGAGIEIRAAGGWLQYPWVWAVALVLALLGCRQLRRSFDRFYDQIPLVPEA